MTATAAAVTKYGPPAIVQQNGQPTERLIVVPEPTVRVDPPTSIGRPTRFIATLESTGDFVVLSHQPLVDGARELLSRGFDPATLLTMQRAAR